MKRIVLSSLLILGMTVPMATPAQAIFGLSTCEKVKKQVLAYEAKINESASFWTKYEMKHVSGKYLKRLENYESANWAGNLVKITYNNPECFTRTQKLEIDFRKKQNWNSRSFINWSKSAKVKNTKKCTSDFNYWATTFPGDPCFLDWDIYIANVYSITPLNDI